MAVSYTHLEVYKDSNDNGELDSEDELLGTLTEKEIGQYEMNDLLYGCLLYTSSTRSAQSRSFIPLSITRPQMM